MRKLWLLLLLASLPAGAQVDIRGSTIVTGSGGGGGCAPFCALTNVANTFTLNNTFPSITVTGGINGLPIYENTGLFNIGLGVGSTPSSSTGIQNLGIGDGTLATLTSGYDNTSIGVAANGSVTTGFENTAIGTFSLQDNVSGGGNTGIGSLALANTTQSYNVGIGNCALCDLIVGGSNVAIGTYAGCGTLCSSGTGPINSVADGIYIGYQAGPSANSVTNQVLIGYNIQSSTSNQMILGNSSITAATIYGLPTFPALGGSGSGCIGISNTGLTSTVSCGSGGGGSAFQVNGVALTSSATVNFVNDTGITVSNPSAGNIHIAAGFAGLAAGTNTGALLIGTGGTLGVSGTGTITATSMPYSGLTGSVPTWNQSTSGTAAGLSGSPAITVSNITDSALTSGDCVQATTGGLLVTTGAACGSGGGGSAFSVITTGTNSAAAMTVGTGATLGTSGSGTIAATTATTAAGPTGTPTLCSSGQGSTGVGASFAAQGCTTFIQGSLTSGIIPKATGAAALGNSAISDSGSQVSISEPLAITGSVPGNIDLVAGTGSLTAAPSNSYAVMGPVTGGTTWSEQWPNAPATAGGMLMYGVPATLNGRSNVMTAKWFNPQATLSTGVGTFGGNALFAVIANTVAANDGKWTNISISTLTAGSGCTTPPQFTVFAGNTVGAYATAPTSETYQNGAQVNVAQTLAFTAGQQIGIVIEAAGSGCTTAQMTVSGQYQDAP